MEEEVDGQPQRKKLFTKSEILQKLEENDYKVKEVASAIAKEMCPFDVSDNEAMQIEDRIERLERSTKNLATKIYRIKTDFKQRKFRHNPALLEEKGVSSSQSSIFQSDDSEPIAVSQGQGQEEGVQRGPYRKKPLNQMMTQFSRRRRVEGLRDVLEKGALDEGVSVSQLLGYLLHLENYHLGDRSMAATGWRIFSGENTFDKAEISVEEAIWMIEIGGLNQLVWQEFRLRLLQRIKLPPVYIIRAENKKHRPALTEYRHGVKASLPECLSLTLSDRLSHMDVSSLDRESQKVRFNFSWGLDGSGDQADYNQLSKTGYSTKQVKKTIMHHGV